MPVISISNGPENFFVCLEEAVAKLNGITCVSGVIYEGNRLSNLWVAIVGTSKMSVTFPYFSFDFSIIRRVEKSTFWGRL